MSLLNGFLAAALLTTTMLLSGAAQAMQIQQFLPKSFMRVASDSHPKHPLASQDARPKYSQARYITQAEFFRSVKEVNLVALQAANKTLDRLLPATRIDRIVSDNLARYGIGTRDDAPVDLFVIVDVTSYTNYEGDLESNLHAITIQLKFVVPAVAVRNGRFVGIRAYPADYFQAVDIEEDNDLRKAVLGDKTAANFEQTLDEFVRDAFARFAGNSKPESSEAVSSWTKTLKVATDQKFEEAIASVQNNHTTTSPSQFMYLDTVPALALGPPVLTGNGCAISESDWRESMREAARRHGMTREVSPPPARLIQSFVCSYGSGNTSFYWVADTMVFTEANVVYMLNGEPVRSHGTLWGDAHGTFATTVGITDVLRNYFLGRASDFAAAK